MPTCASAADKRIGLCATWKRTCRWMRKTRASDCTRLSGSVVRYQLNSNVASVYLFDEGVVLWE